MQRMIQIDSKQVTPVLSSLFDLDTPTCIRALAVLAGGNKGKIFTDDPACPHWGLVWEADDGTLYRGGKYGREVLSDAVALLRKEDVVALGFRDCDPSVDLFPPDPDAGAACLEFDRPIGGSDLSPYLGDLPAGYTIHRMDRSLLERSPKCAEKVNRYGSIENLLSKAIAVCILQGEEIVCGAYADMEILGRREIGVITQATYRKQGFATFACAFLIQLCEASGAQTYWDCARLNLGSVALARKLGFQNEREYKLLAWFDLA
jgi:RimJ/RimL family protein N-acetyltransferase